MAFGLVTANMTDLRTKELCQIIILLVVPLIVLSMPVKCSQAETKMVLYYTWQNILGR